MRDQTDADGLRRLASLFAHAAFWLLLFYGWLSEDISPRTAVLPTVRENDAD